MVNKKGMGKAVQGGVSLPKEWETTNFQNHFLIVYYNWFYFLLHLPFGKTENSGYQFWN